MNDLISRQAAIDALQKEINKGIPPFDDVMGSIRCGVRLARNIIEDLPSAQPETHDKRTETRACDCISRQAAIDAVKDWYDGLICGSFKGLKKRLEALPSAQQWIPCTERMPEDGTSCLVLFDENLLDNDENLVGDALWKDGQWQYFTIRTFEQSGWHISFEPFESLKVIAWMPLPELYKGEQE